jgi:hypothetical protein
MPQSVVDAVDHSDERDVPSSHQRHKTGVDRKTPTTRLLYVCSQYSSLLLRQFALVTDYH